MKKVTVIALTLLMVLALSVPAFASETYTLQGTWVLNEQLTITADISNYSLDYLAEYDVEGQHIVLDGYGIKVQKTSSAKELYFLGYAGTNTRTEWVYNNKWKTTFFSDTVRTITFNGANVVTEQFYTWFTSNATQTDRGDFGDGGGSGFVRPPEWDQDALPYGCIIMNEGTGIYYFHASDQPFTYSTETQLLSNTMTNITRYTATGSDSITSDDWTNAGVFYGFSWSTTSFPVVWSSHDIYDETGALFFVATPNMLVEAVKGAPMMEVTTQVLTLIPIVMAFLVLCLGLRKALRTLVQMLRNG